MASTKVDRALLHKNNYNNVESTLKLLHLTSPLRHRNGMLFKAELKLTFNLYVKGEGAVKQDWRV